MEQSVMLMRTYDIVIDAAFSTGVDLYLASFFIQQQYETGFVKSPQREAGAVRSAKIVNRMLRGLRR